MAVQGELWAEARSVFVRSGSVFHPCPFGLIPYGAREYDKVTVHPNAHGVVEKIVAHVREPIHRRPRGFRPPTGVHIGKVTHYQWHIGGTIDNNIAFAPDVVKALGGGEAQVGEIVEYILDAKGCVTRVTGPFDTHVSAVGRRLK